MSALRQEFVQSMFQNVCVQPERLARKNALP